MFMPKTLVELTFSKMKGLCIAETGEVALNPQMLSGIVPLKYFGPDYASDDGESFRDKAIRGNSPQDANSYIGDKQISNTGIIGGSSYSFVMYFHIDDEQARNVPKPQPIYHSHTFEGPIDSDSE